MQMVGGGVVHEYGPQDERPHEPGPQRNWQESFVLMWWDFKHAVGGMHRLGQEPHYNGEQAIIWSTVYTPDDIFHRVSAARLTAADSTPTSLSGDGGALGYRFDEACVWTIEEPDLYATLRLEDFHPAIDGYLKDGASQLDKLASNHVEVSSRVVAAQSQEQELCHRCKHGRTYATTMQVQKCLSREVPAASATALQTPTGMRVRT